LVYPETREYAYLILTDQPATTPELQALVAHKKVSVPEPDPVPFRKWAREDGPIDEHYIKLVIEDNKEVAASFEQATKSSDPEIATYARKTLPVVQNHLKASLALTKVTE
jgi:predicted outer membrane protein